MLQAVRLPAHPLLAAAAQHTWCLTSAMPKAEVAGPAAHLSEDPPHTSVMLNSVKADNPPLGIGGGGAACAALSFCQAQYCEAWQPTSRRRRCSLRSSATLIFSLGS